jgi:hypothetical protein
MNLLCRFIPVVTIVASRIVSGLPFRTMIRSTRSSGRALSSSASKEPPASAAASKAKVKSKLTKKAPPKAAIASETNLVDNSSSAVVTIEACKQ